MSIVKHYGIKRRSGRYPWGSGDNAQERSTSFFGYIEGLRKMGLTDTDIARGYGMTTTEFRATKAIARAEKRAGDEAQAWRLKEKGMSNVAIGERMGVNESSVRNLLRPSLSLKNQSIDSTANMLRNAVNDKKFVDVGIGVENYLGVARTKLNTSIEVLKSEGYVVETISIVQLGTGQKTNVKVLADKGNTWGTIYKNRDKIQLIQDHTFDGGRSWLGLEPIKNVDSNRLSIRYAEDGGTQKDGVIELRRGVSDLNLGASRYAQVRIGVDGTHYLKGMVMYADDKDMPIGVDMVFNTNKSNKTPKMDTLKKMTDDPDNPFGATIKRGGQRGALNIVNEEGDWDRWSKTISSQVLSKQQPKLIKEQLELAYKLRKEEYDEIISLTNPVIKKKLLAEFADGSDAASVHLKAAGLPRQSTKVILPFPDMKENEVYAPTYNDGERLVLIRFPHGGRFEIAELIVNNKHKKAKAVIENASDAIGLNSKVADDLSGADFDGDFVLAIPNNKGSIKTAHPLTELKGFDPKESYPAYDGMKQMTSKQKGLQMGNVSNLITDMTIRGASDAELARAVKHSMVVIDAEKHNLNWKQSAIDNDISGLKTTYQGSAKSGASTLISKASSEQRIAKRTEGEYRTDPETGKTKKIYIDPQTGRKLYTTIESSWTDKDGKLHRTTTKSTKMAEVDDAFDLSSGTVVEDIYATHANKLKALANEARKEYVKTPKAEYSPTAKQTYSKEVESLDAKLSIAVRNKPLERQAQLIGNTVLAAKRQANPDMEASEIKKIKNQALDEARQRVGAKKQDIQISNNEWEAIQAGAISNSKLTRILDNTDTAKVKELALPRETTSVSDTKITKAKSMLAKGYTQAEVAAAVGVPTSTLMSVINPN